MKILICLSLIYTLPTFACTLNSADVIATVANLQKDSRGCTTYVQAENVESFVTHLSCPLSFKQVSGTPIQLELTADNQCSLDIGDELIGTLQKLPDGTIILKSK